ncbi:MAG: hypothetical protein ACAI43_01765 [Phycisphaerae bacterium]
MAHARASLLRHPGTIAALVAVALYAPTLWGTFVYDDVFQCTRDPRLADPGRWGEYFTEAYFPHGPDRLWRPLVSLSYAVQHHLHGPVAWPFHLVNVVLHAGVSALVAVLAMRIGRWGFRTERGGAWWAGAVAGVLFAVHPVHVEGVAYVVGRADSACALGTLGAVVIATGRWTPRRAAAIVACVAVAVFSKEQGLLAPAMVAGVWALKRAGEAREAVRAVAPDMAQSQPAAVHALEYARAPKSALSPEQRVARWLAVVLVFAMAGYAHYRERQFKWTFDAESLDAMIQPLAAAKGADRWLIPVAVLGRAAQLMVAPVRLSPEYGFAVITPMQSVSDPYLWAGFATAIVGVGGLAVAWRRRAWGVVFLLASAGATYGVVSNVTLIGTVFGERLLYLPSAFLIALLGLPFRTRAPSSTPGAGPDGDAPNSKYRGALVTLFAIVVALFAIRTVTYAIRWNDRLGFYEQSWAEQPRAVRLAVLVAEERIGRGDVAGARRVVDRGLAIAPDYWKLWSLATWAAIEAGDWPEAERRRDGAWKRNAWPPEMLWMDKRMDERKKEVGR